MILKSFEFQCDFDFDFQITTSKMIWILILNHLYLGDLILILKSSTYDDFAHLWYPLAIVSKLQITNLLTAVLPGHSHRKARRAMGSCPEILFVWQQKEANPPVFSSANAVFAEKF